MLRQKSWVSDNAHDVAWNSKKPKYREQKGVQDSWHIGEITRLLIAINKCYLPEHVNYCDDVSLYIHSIYQWYCKYSNNRTLQKMTLSFLVQNAWTRFQKGELLWFNSLCSTSDQNILRQHEIFLWLKLWSLGFCLNIMVRIH